MNNYIIKLVTSSGQRQIAPPIAADSPLDALQAWTRHSGWQIVDRISNQPRAYSALLHRDLASYCWDLHGIHYVIADAS